MNFPDGFDAVISVDKPAGPSSFDMVWLMRKALGVKKVGHCGTLDPFATGLLLLCSGRATRVAELLMRRPKIYRAGVLFGVSTTTGDPTGEVIATADASRVDSESLCRCLPVFTGEIMQRPHRFSAVKKDGKRLYSLARAGLQVQADERPVTIYRIEVVSIEPPACDSTVRAILEVECSSGTYIRTLAEDIGSSLGTGGSLFSLRRTAIGAFGVDGAVSVPPPGPDGRYGAEGAAELGARLSGFAGALEGPGAVSGPFASIDAALNWLPRAVCNAEGARAVGTGGPLRASGLETWPECGLDDTFAVIDPSGRVLALHTWLHSASAAGRVASAAGRVASAAGRPATASAAPDERLSRPLKVLVG